MKLATPALDGLADLAHGGRRDLASQDEVEGEVGVGMAGESIAALFHLLHYGVGRGSIATRNGQVPGEIDKGGHTAKGRSPAGRLGRLGNHFGAAGPRLGHRYPNVGVGLYASRQYDLSSGVNGPARLHLKTSGGGHKSDLLPLNSHVHNPNTTGCHYPATANNQVQHVRLLLGPALPAAKFLMFYVDLGLAISRSTSPFA